MHVGLTEPPRSFPAGTTVSWKRSYGDFPPATWNLTLHLRGPSSLDVAAAEVAGEFVVTLTAAETATLAPGGYRWAERVTDGTSTHEVARGRLNVVLDLATVGPKDALSWEERVLPLLDAALEGRASRDLDAYVVGGLSVSKMSVRELRRFRNAIVATINARRRGGRVVEDVLARFTGTGR